MGFGPLFYLLLGVLGIRKGVQDSLGSIRNSPERTSRRASWDDRASIAGPGRSGMLGFDDVNPAVPITRNIPIIPIV